MSVQIAPFSFLPLLYLPMNNDCGVMCCCCTCPLVLLLLSIAICCWRPQTAAAESSRRQPLPPELVYEAVQWLPYSRLLELCAPAYATIAMSIHHFASERAEKLAKRIAALRAKQDLDQKEYVRFVKFVTQSLPTQEAQKVQKQLLNQLVFIGYGRLEFPAQTAMDNGCLVLLRGEISFYSIVYERQPGGGVSRKNFRHYDSEELNAQIYAEKIVGDDGRLLGFRFYERPPQYLLRAPPPTLFATFLPWSSDTDAHLLHAELTECGVNVLPLPEGQLVVTRRRLLFGTSAAVLVLAVLVATIWFSPSAAAEAIATLRLRWNEKF